MNQVQVTGRLVRDPEARQLPDGRAVCTIRLAVDGMGRGNETGYLDVTEFGPAAAASARTLSKGWLVAASGRLDYREWDGKDGQRRTAIGLVGRIEFLASPRHQGERHDRGEIENSLLPIQVRDREEHVGSACPAGRCPPAT